MTKIDKICKEIGIIKKDKCTSPYSHLYEQGSYTVLLTEESVNRLAEIEKHPAIESIRLLSYIGCDFQQKAWTYLLKLKPTIEREKEPTCEACGNPLAGNYYTARSGERLCHQCRLHYEEEFHNKSEGE